MGWLGRLLGRGASQDEVRSIGRIGDLDAHLTADERAAFAADPEAIPGAAFVERLSSALTARGASCSVDNHAWCHKLFVDHGGRTHELQLGPYGDDAWLVQLAAPRPSPGVLVLVDATLRDLGVSDLAWHSPARWSRGDESNGAASPLAP